MAANLFGRYVWLIDTLRRHKRLTFQEISELWQESGLGYGEELPLRTFHNHQKAIKDIFDVYIDCDRKDGYRYYIDEPERLEGNNLQSWLISSYATLNQIQADNKLEDRIIKANFDGIVAYLNVAEGDYLVAKDEVGTMIDRTYLKALVEVAETDSSKIKPGQKVMFSFPAYEDHKIEGYLVSSYAIATVTSRGASVVKAEVRINNPPEQILPNYSFIGEIEISPPETILLVERQAIGYGEDGSPFAEKILPDGTTERVPVTVTAYGNAFVKIISGLQDKDVLKQQSTGTVPIGGAEAPPPPPDK